MHRHAVVPPKLRLGNSPKRPCRRHYAARGTPKVSEVSVDPGKPMSSPRTGCPGGHAESVELSTMVGYGATWPHRPRPRRSKLFAQVDITHAPAVSRWASADLGAASLTISTLRTNLIGGKFSCRRGRPAPPPVAPSRRGLSGQTSKSDPGHAGRVEAMLAILKADDISCRLPPALEIAMTSETRKAVEAELLRLLEAQAHRSMPAQELIEGITAKGTSELDAREALMSLMVRDDVELTSDRRIRLELNVAA